MVAPEKALLLLAATPAPAALRDLQRRLLAAGVAAEHPVWAPLDNYFTFLTALAARASSREFSHFASLLDMGAVGGVSLQNLLTGREEGKVWQRLLAGTLSEGLMVLAARQYVRAWEGEMAAVYEAAAWYLYRALWQVSITLRPALSSEERQRLLGELVTPLVAQEGLEGTQRAALAVRLYQILLLAHLQLIVQEQS